MQKECKDKRIMIESYFILSRKIFESAIWRDNPSLLKLFIWIIGNARYDKTPKKYPGVTIQRGELVTSLANIAESNEYTYRNSVRRWSRSYVSKMLVRLETEEYIVLCEDTYGTHIKVCNYNIYQEQKRYVENRKRTDWKQIGNRLETDSVITKQENQEKQGKQGKQDIKRNLNIKIFIDYFFDAFNEKTGDKYHVEGGKDGKTVKRLLNTYTINELKDLCDIFFQSTDEFILKAGYTIGVFLSQVNKLNIIPHQTKVSDRTLKNMQAMDNFLNEKDKKQ